MLINTQKPCWEAKHKAEGKKEEDSYSNMKGIVASLILRSGMRTKLVDR